LRNKSERAGGALLITQLKLLGNFEGPAGESLGFDKVAGVVKGLVEELNRVIPFEAFRARRRLLIGLSEQQGRED
jgi:hypothetical protein